MSTSLEVHCIKKHSRESPHERIHSIGGQIGPTYRWQHTHDQAIAYIESGTFDYYVSQGGNRVRVIIATHLGHKYLKTEADGIHPNNLLSLPECPA